MKKLLTLLALGTSLTASVAHVTEAFAAPSSQEDMMVSCNADAKTKELKGEEQKKFVSECLRAKVAEAARAPIGTPSQNKMKTCQDDAKTKPLKAEETNAFIKECMRSK